MNTGQDADSTRESKVSSTIGKIGRRRHVVIPQHICEELHIQEGDFVEILSEKGMIILKPKKLVDAQEFPVSSPGTGSV
jgi:AbrB family looped-hinge helix DNA binding protein